MKSIKGFSLIEIMLTIILVTIATSIAFQYYDNYLDEQLNQTTAQQQKQVNKAAQTYIKANYNTIAAQAMPYTITMATLQAAGFPSLPLKNPFAQSYNVVVRNPGSGLMALVVTTGGQTIDEKNLPRISKLVGADGGYISSTNTAVAYGAYKAWTETLANYGVAPGAGHLASALFFDSTSVVSDYLYRSAVPGMPSLNTMNTDLNMGANDITNAASVTATGALKGATATITGALTANTVTTNGETVNGNETVTGTSTVGTLAVTGNSKVAGAETVNGAFVGGSVKSNQDVIASRYLQLNTVVTEGSACTTTGQVALDSTGALLSCQSSRWKKQFGNSFVQSFAAGSSCGGGGGADSVAACPAGYSLTGGGYRIVHWEPIPKHEYSHSNAPDASYPGSGSSWVVHAGVAPGKSCFQAFAVCLK